jgi:hypothetical protein
MNILLQLLVATALIAVLIMLRMYSNRQVLQHRSGCDKAGKEKECAGGCSGLKAAVEHGTDPTELNLKRSV